MKFVTCFLAFIFSYTIAVCQIHITSIRHSYNIFPTSAIFEFTVNNSYNMTIPGHFEIQIFNSQNLPILSFKSNITELLPGMNSNWQNLINNGQFLYYPIEESTSLQKYGVLQTGEYDLCISYFASTDLEIPVRNCSKIQVMNSLNIKLISPCDNCEISSPNPILNWISHFSFDDSYSFSIKICKINDGQSSHESQYNNVPLVYQTNLKESYLNYDLQFPILNNRSDYSWQVALIKNNAIILQSEIWTFHLPNNIKPKSIDNLREITPSRNLHEYIYEEHIAFLYNNRFDMAFVEISINDLSNKSNTIYSRQIELNSYSNEIYIPFNEIPNLKEDHLYQLSFYDVRRQPHFLYFKRKNK